MLDLTPLPDVQGGALRRRVDNPGSEPRSGLAAASHRLRLVAERIDAYSVCTYANAPVRVQRHMLYLVEGRDK